MRRPLVAVCLVVLLAGCSRQDFSRGPVHNPLADILDSGRPYTPARKSQAQLRMERFAKVLAAQRRRPRLTAADYRIGPNDVLSISVFALEEPGKTTTLTRNVTESGHFTLPWIGKETARRCTTRELEEHISKGYAGRYLADPQVTVTVTEHRSVAVTGGGAVNKPGVYYLKRNSSTALEMLAMAGGPTEAAGDLLLVIRGNDENADPQAKAARPAATRTPSGTRAKQRTDEHGIVRVDMKQLVEEGNLLVNLEVRNGDVITVPPRAKAFVYVLGYVRRPGAYELKDGMEVDALRVVALGGGLTSTARASNSVLIRRMAKGQKIIPIDLNKIARGVRPPVYMEPDDTLVVGSSFTARLSEVIRPTANVGASAGF